MAFLPLVSMILRRHPVARAGRARHPIACAVVLTFCLPWGGTCPAASGAAGGALPTFAHFGLGEEQALFFPGTYFFHKGCEYYKRGAVETALAMWEVAASWGQKSAQYDLGIAWFEGKGVTADRPRGLAWLALAAERGDAGFQDSLALAWQQSTEAEHQRANALWRDLEPTFADAVALARARHRYREQLRGITGARTGHPIGNMVVITPQGSQDASLWLASIEDEAAAYFGTATGSVRIGPLTALPGASAADASPEPAHPR
jgi:hypothetical protein